MRGFIPGSLCLALAACVQQAYDDAKALSVADESSSTGTSSTSSTGALDPDPTGAIQTVTGAPTSTGTTGSTGAVDATGTTDPTGEPIIPPEIVAVDLPSPVTAAGPVHVTVLAQHAASVRGVLDGQQDFVFIAEGDENGDGVDVFTTEIPIVGAKDNGVGRTFEVIAERDGLEDHELVSFDVNTPPAGTVAWERFGGPGTRTTSLAVDPDGFIYEGGSLVVGDKPRPSVRKRHPLTGNDVWPGGPITVDTREGVVADLAFTADGDAWVAMNVRENNNTWLARIARLDGDMQPTGDELPPKYDATVTALAVDADGGCVATGFITTQHGDTDILLWRIEDDGDPVYSGHPWDYKPTPDDAHKFSDLAFDIVLDQATNVAWVAGGTRGEHEFNKVRVRGLVFGFNIFSLALQEPVIVAQPSGNFVQSIFYGAALDPEGIVVTGNECVENCNPQRRRTVRYDLNGWPTWNDMTDGMPVAFGAGVARTTGGVILTASNLKPNQISEGALIAHLGAEEPYAALPFPGEGTSSANAVVVDPYDRTFCGGQATVAGASQSYLMRVNQ